MSKRELQKQQTRAALLSAAMDVYKRDGIAAARTADVAAAAGVAHGSVFVHFPTREALFISAIEEFGMALAKRLHELAAEGAGLREVLQAHLQGIAEHEGFYARLAIESPLLPPEARLSVLSIQSAISHHISQAADHDERAGLIKPMPLHLLFNTWIGLVHHYLANRDLVAPGASVIERHGAELVGHFMSLVASCPELKEDPS
jgi:AcrR family transcriptional regulator